MQKLDKGHRNIRDTMRDQTISNMNYARKKYALGAPSEWDRSGPECNLTAKVKWGVARDRNIKLKNFAEEAQNASDRNDAKKFFHITKVLPNPTKRRKKGVRLKSWKVTFVKKKVEDRWIERFAEAYSGEVAIHKKVKRLHRLRAPFVLKDK